MDDVIIGILLFSITLLIVFAAVLFFGKYQYIKANRILGFLLFLFALSAANLVSQMLHIVPGYFQPEARAYRTL